MTEHADRVAGAVGFVGLGIRGQPMALNLARAGVPLVVWNRSADRCEPLHAAVASVAASPAAGFARARTVVAILANVAATDAVLGRGSLGFGPMVAGWTLVCMESNCQGLDLEAFAAAIDAGPMASDVTRVKLPKLVGRDFAPRAAMADAPNSERRLSVCCRGRATTGACSTDSCNPSQSSSAGAILGGDSRRLGGPSTVSL